MRVNVCPVIQGVFPALTLCVLGLAPATLYRYKGKLMDGWMEMKRAYNLWVAGLIPWIPRSGWVSWPHLLPGVQLQQQPPALQIELNAWTKYLIVYYGIKGEMPVSQQRKSLSGQRCWMDQHCTATTSAYLSLQDLNTSFSFFSFLFLFIQHLHLCSVSNVF